MQTPQLHLGDCLDVMPRLSSGSVDMVLADPPYGTTACKWDYIIPPGSLWDCLKWVSKPNAAIVMTASQPFTSTLVTSNLKMFRYSLVWEKPTASGHLNAKRMPMRAHEDILCFYRKPPVYNPQKTSGHTRKVATAAHGKNCKATECYGSHGRTTYDSTERYPRSVIKISTDTQQSSRHPAQKPVALMEYLIRTYTNPGDTVLDFSMGSGTTGVACANEGRAFIGIEKDPEIFVIAQTRLAGTVS